MRRLVLILLFGVLAGACAPRVSVREPSAAAAGLRVVRAGHATVWLDVAGFRVLTDPLFVGWLWMFPRADALGLDPDHLPPVDAAVVSHSHMDHFDPWSIDHIPGPVPVLFPQAVPTAPLDGAFYRRMVRRQPTYVYPWWRSVTVRNREGKVARITCVPAKHWGGRLGFDGLWSDTYGGWILESGGYTVYFAGDTGWDEAMFREIARRFPHIDLALLPIGPVLSRGDGRMRASHIDPPQALNAFRLLGARRMIPIHYGAFYQSPFGPDVPLEWLRELLPSEPAADRVAILAPGEPWVYPGTPAVAAR